MNWIPLTDRLPIEGKEVVLMSINRQSSFKPYAHAKSIGSLVNTGRMRWMTSSREYYLNEFTHWCELPNYPQ